MDDQCHPKFARDSADCKVVKYLSLQLAQFLGKALPCFMHFFTGMVIPFDKLATAYWGIMHDPCGCVFRFLILSFWDVVVLLELRCSSFAHFDVSIWSKKIVVK
jgi:hypothetical protein